MSRMKSELRGLAQKAVKAKQDHPTLSILAAELQNSPIRRIKFAPWVCWWFLHPPTINNIIPSMLVYDNSQVQGPERIVDAEGETEEELEARCQSCNNHPWKVICYLKKCSCLMCFLLTNQQWIPWMVENSLSLCLHGIGQAIILMWL